MNKPHISKIWIEEGPDQIAAASSLNRPQIGIIAKAEILTPSNTRQIIRSAGLWGVDATATDDYKGRIALEQLDSLSNELAALGVGPRAIAYALTKVERAAA